MIAEARAKMSSQGARHGEPEVVPTSEDIRPVEDRYIDDGSLTPDDRKKFSLRTGGTAANMPTVKPGQVPGEAMSEHDVIREVSGSRRAVVIAVAAIVVVAIVAVVMMMMRGKPVPAPAKAPAASAVPAPTAPSKAALTGAAATKPGVPAKTSRREAKIVAAPPSKRSDSDKRASRRKTKPTGPPEATARARAPLPQTRGEGTSPRKCRRRPRGSILAPIRRPARSRSGRCVRAAGTSRSGRRRAARASGMRSGW